MDKELIDGAWACLPREFREEVKKEYYDCKHCNADACAIELEVVFGEHNLTSDAEGEEMLYAKRSDVIKEFDKLHKYSYQVADLQLGLNAFRNLYGSKCLPDEVADEDNFASKEPRIEDGEKESFTYPKFRTGDKVLFNNNICRIIGTDREDAEYQLERIIDNHLMGWAEENEISLYEETKPAKPKFKVGDRVITPERGKNMPLTIRCKTGKHYYAFEEIDYDIHEDYLEPYTEQEENVNLSQESANRDKQFDAILKDSFSKERRLHIAAMVIASIMGSNDWSDYRGGTDEEVWHNMAKASLGVADALIKEAEKGNSDGED